MPILLLAALPTLQATQAKPSPWGLDIPGLGPYFEKDVEAARKSPSAAMALIQELRSFDCGQSADGFVSPDLQRALLKHLQDEAARGDGEAMYWLALNKAYRILSVSVPEDGSGPDAWFAEAAAKRDDYKFHYATWLRGRGRGGEAASLFKEAGPGLLAMAKAGDRGAQYLLTSPGDRKTLGLEGVAPEPDHWKELLRRQPDKYRRFVMRDEAIFLAHGSVAWMEVLKRNAEAGDPHEAIKLAEYYQAKGKVELAWRYLDRAVSLTGLGCLVDAVTHGEAEWPPRPSR